MNSMDPVTAGFDPQRLDRLTPWMQRSVDAGKLPFGQAVRHSGARPKSQTIGHIP